MEYMCVICTELRQGKCKMCEPSDFEGKVAGAVSVDGRTTASHSGLPARVKSRRFEQLAEGVLTTLNRQGYCVVDKFHEETKALAIMNEVKRIQEAGLMQNGQLMSSQTSPNIRGDQIAWVQGTEEGIPNILSHMKRVDMLVAMLNNKIPHYTITGRTKAMVACYPGESGCGKRYVKHVDNPCKDGRCITTLYYLNKDYDRKVDGGVLRLYPGNTEKYVDIEPVLDRFLIFWSDKRNPHEVLPAYSTRYAITLWYFDEEERRCEGERLARLSQQANKNSVVP